MRPNQGHDGRPSETDGKLLLAGLGVDDQHLVLAVKVARPSCEPCAVRSKGDHANRPRFHGPTLPLEARVTRLLLEFAHDHSASLAAACEVCVAVGTFRNGRRRDRAAVRLAEHLRVTRATHA